MTSDLSVSIQELVTANEEVLQLLTSLKNEIEQHKKDLVTVKSVGTIVNAIGAVATLLGLALIPLSGGASLGLTALGIAAGVGGSTANLVADIIDHFKRKEFTKSLQSTTKLRENVASDLTVKLEIVNQVYQCLLDSNLEEEQAIAAAITFVIVGQAEQFMEENAYITLLPHDENVSDTRQRVLSILNSDHGQLCFKVIGAIGKTAGNMPKVAELAKFHGLLATVAKNTCRGLFAALGIVVTISEIRLLYNLIRTGHPTAYIVEDFCNSLIIETDNLKEIAKICNGLENLYVDSIYNETCDEGASTSQSYNSIIIDAGDSLLDISVENVTDLQEDGHILDFDNRSLNFDDDDISIDDKNWKVILLKGGAFMVRGFGLVLKVWPKLYYCNNDAVAETLRLQIKH